MISPPIGLSLFLSSSTRATSTNCMLSILGRVGSCRSGSASSWSFWPSRSKSARLAADPSIGVIERDHSARQERACGPSTYKSRLVGGGWPTSAFEHSGLKSDIARCPKRAHELTHRCDRHGTDILLPHARAVGLFDTSLNHRARCCESLGIGDPVFLPSIRAHWAVMSAIVY